MANHQLVTNLSVLINHQTICTNNLNLQLQIINQTLQGLIVSIEEINHGTDNYLSYNNLHKLEKDQPQLNGPRKHVDILKETKPKDQLQFEVLMNVVDDKSVHDLKELGSDKNLHILDRPPPLISPPPPPNISLTVEEPNVVMKNCTSLSSNKENGSVLEKIYVPLVSPTEEIYLMANPVYIQQNTLQETMEFVTGLHNEDFLFVTILRCCWFDQVLYMVYNLPHIFQPKIWVEYLCWVELKRGTAYTSTLRTRCFLKG